ncbi:MAG: hypothetical protein ACKVH8_01460 [Pirellulales bacterium]
MKQVKYSQVIAFIGLLLVIAVLHHDEISHHLSRHLTMFSCARDGLLESAKYQFIDEIELLDKDQSVIRVLVFSTQLPSNDAINTERVVITDANYQICSHLEFIGTTRIQNIAVLRLESTPILEILRYRVGGSQRAVCTQYFIQNGELIPRTANRV